MSIYRSLRLSLSLYIYIYIFMYVSPQVVSFTLGRQPAATNEVGSSGQASLWRGARYYLFYMIMLTSVYNIYILIVGPPVSFAPCE